MTYLLLNYVLQIKDPSENTNYILKLIRQRLWLKVYDLDFYGNSHI